jgi:phosphinothricin acetyltransferase
MIRPASEQDAAAICAIYNHFVRTTTISFEEQAVSEAGMAKRIREYTAVLPWLVFEQDGVVAGYAYATLWRVRAAYRFSVESSIYVSPDMPGRGIGSALYRALIGELRHRGAHAVIGGIAQPNPASVALHEKLGFEKVAHFKQVGRKFDRWVDVGYWELLLNARGD